MRTQAMCLAFSIGVSISTIVLAASDLNRMDIQNIFSVSLPRGTEYIPLHGDDSLIGRIKGSGFQADFDYGHYARKLDPNRVSQRITVDGKPADLVVRKDCSLPGESGIFIGLYISHIDVIETSVATYVWADFSIEGCAMDEQSAVELEQLYRSIHFLRKPFFVK